VLWSKFEVPKDDKPKFERAAHISIAQCHRNYRSKLYIEHVKTGEPPFAKHPHILPTDWAVFVKSKETPEFEEKSAKGKALRERNVTPHTLGSRGYANKIPVWEREDAQLREAGQPVPFGEIDERARNWVLGHSNRSTGSVPFPNTIVEDVSRRLVRHPRVLVHHIALYHADIALVVPL
jgi:hypothetical protein